MHPVIFEYLSLLVFGVGVSLFILSISFYSGHFGLWLDESFYHGSSLPCSTFDNKCLSSREDFICEGVEAWGFR